MRPLRVHPHRALVNGIIGLVEGAHQWPRTLRDYGFEVVRVETEFINSAGETVRPDVITSSRKFNHSLVFDLKSGTVEERSLVKLGNIDADDLTFKVGVPFTDKDTHSFDPIIACFEDNLPGVLSAISDSNQDFAVLCFYPDAMRLVRGELGLPRLSKEVTGGVPLDLSVVPLSFLPFNGNSPPKDIVPHLCQALVSLLVNGCPGFSLPQICEASNPMWRRLSGDDRQILLKRTRQLVDRLSEVELQEYVEKDSVAPTESLRWRFLIDGESMTAGQISAIKRRLQVFAETADAGRQFPFGDWVQEALEFVE